VTYKELDNDSEVSVLRYLCSIFMFELEAVLYSWTP